MRKKPELRLVVVSLATLAVACLSYWVVSENARPVLPKGSANVLLSSQPPPTSIATAPASAIPSGLGPPTFQSPSTAAALLSRGSLDLPNEDGVTEADRRLVQDALRRLGYYEGAPEWSVRTINPSRYPPFPA